MTDERTLTDADVEAICKGIHHHGCVMFEPTVTERLIAFGTHTTLQGAEAVGELGTAIAGERKFYGKIILRGIVIVVASAVVFLFGRNAWVLLTKGF